MLEIKVEKIVKDKKKQLKLLDFKGLSSEQLPCHYWNSAPAVAVNSSVLTLRFKAEDFDLWKELFGTGVYTIQGSETKHAPVGVLPLQRGDILTLQQWKKISTHITDAGERLHKINKALNENWTGTAVIKW